jgi:hypothetical protein
VQILTRYEEWIRTRERGSNTIKAAAISGTISLDISD